MMFDKLNIKDIQNYKKTETRRLVKSNRRPAIPGNKHKVKKDRTDRTYGIILIKDVYKEKLGDITEKSAKNEGFDSIEDFLDYFEKINGTRDQDTIVWVIKFKLVCNPKTFKNIGRIDRTDPKNGIFIVSNGIEANNDDIVYSDDPENVLEDIIWDLTKYQCEFLVDDANFDLKNNEFFIDISEEYENDYKPTTIKEFKEWITNKDCDWFYEVDRFKEYKWGLRIFLKF